MRWYLLVVISALLFGQGSPEREQRRKLAREFPEPGVEQLMALRSARIDEALRSPEPQVHEAEQLLADFKKCQ